MGINAWISDYIESFLWYVITAPCPKFNNIIYREVSNIRRILVGSKIVDHSDVVGASPVGAAPTTSSFST